MAVDGGSGQEMERDFDSKLRLQQSSPTAGGGGSTVQRTNSIVFRAPQEQFTINDFDLGKLYGVGSYSKVRSFFLSRSRLFVSFSFISFLPLYMLSYHHNYYLRTVILFEVFVMVGTGDAVQKLISSIFSKLKE